MNSLEQMRQYVHAADSLDEAQREIAKWEQVAARAKAQMERAALSMDTGLTIETPPPLLTAEGALTDAEIQQRALKANKRIRGEATLAIMKALPGTIAEITERTGLKPTSVSTLMARLQNDGLVKKNGRVSIPGYENRTTFTYDLAV